MRFVKQLNGKYLDTQSSDNSEITLEQLTYILNQHSNSLSKLSTAKNVNTGKSVKERVQSLIDDLTESKNA